MRGPQSSQSVPSAHTLYAAPGPPSSQSPSLLWLISQLPHKFSHLVVPLVDGGVGDGGGGGDGDGGGGGNGDGGSLDSDGGESSDTLQMHLLAALHGLPPRRGLLISLPVEVWKKQPLGIH